MNHLAGFYINYPMLFWLLAGVLGLLITTLLNALVVRLPALLKRQWLVESRQFMVEQNEAAAPAAWLTRCFGINQCPQCHQHLPFWQHVPLLGGWLVSQHCRYCHHRLSWHYPILESTALLIVALAFYQLGLGYQWLLTSLLLLWLLTLAVIDLREMLLPDLLTLPLLWLGLLVNSHALFVPLPDAVWGAALGYLFLWGVFWLFKALTGREGLGYGDFKLLAAIGAWLGWHALPSILLVSACVGALVGIVLVMTKKVTRQSALPFGPFLTLGTMVYLLA